MALMPNQWQIEQENIQRKREAHLLLEEKKEYLLANTNATNEDLLGIIFDLKKRLEKLEDKLDHLSNRDQMF